MKALIVTLGVFIVTAFAVSGVLKIFDNSASFNDVLDKETFHRGMEDLKKEIRKELSK